MSSAGTITADIIKNAMFKAADEIEGRYKKMPKTFADYWTLIKNKAIQAFNPVIEKINQLINTPQFEEFFNNLCVGIQLAAEAIEWLIDSITWLCQVLEPVVPLLFSLAGAFVAVSVATKLASAAKWAFGDALSMITTKSGIVITAIIALIAILAYLYTTNDNVAYGILYLWDALQIGALTLWIGIKTAFYGIVIAAQTLWLGILGVVYGVVAALMGFETGCQAVAVGIALIFQYMYNSVANRINGIITLLNKIPGVKIDTVQAATFGDEAAEQMINDVTQRNKDLQGIMDQIKSTSASIETNKANFGADLENTVFELQAKVQDLEDTRQNRVNERNDWITDLENEINGALDLGDSVAGKLGQSSIPVTADGGSLDSAGQVDISDEDLQYLKDFAEQEFINKFTTATLAPNVTVQFGDVHENADVEAIKDRIQEILEEEIAEVAEGVYD